MADQPVEKRIHAAGYDGCPEGRLYNATIETLALLLFKDHQPGANWYLAHHETREKYRRMAEGQEPLKGL